MNVIQIYRNVINGDGVSNIIMDVADILTEQGISNSVIALNEFNSQRVNVRCFDSFDEMRFNEDDIIIYHLANGDELNYKFERLHHKKILFYHNVSYPYFFRNWDEETQRVCERGATDAKETVDNYMKAITLSDFSRNQLIGYGWKPQDVISIPFFSAPAHDVDYSPKKDDAYSKFLFVGRVSPNKKIEDVIRIFGYYQKNYDNNASLTLAGRIPFLDYYKCLTMYIEDNQIENVTFTDFISDEDLRRCYEEAGIFLCMSEHEGFCIPLLEGMAHKNLVIGYRASAVPDTMRDAGIIVETKDEKEVSDIIFGIVNDNAEIKRVLNSQLRRLGEINVKLQGEKLHTVLDEIDHKDIPIYRYEKEVLDKYIEKVHMKKQIDIFKPLVDSLYASGKKLVIYGAGKAGKEVYNGLLCMVNKDRLIFCDNGRCDSEYMGIPMIDHKKCITDHIEDVIVVTVQNSLLSIYSSLITSGVCSERIYVYDMKSKRILKA